MPFPFMKMKMSVLSENFSQHCILWKPYRSVKSASHGPLQRSLSAECSGTSRLKAAPLGLLCS